MSFASGFAAGVTAFAIALQLLAAAWWLPALRAMYRDLGGALPAVSALAVSPAWAWGAPLALGAALAVLCTARLRSERSRSLALTIAAAVAIAALGFTAWAARSPIHQTASAIAAD